MIIVTMTSTVTWGESLCVAVVVYTAVCDGGCGGPLVVHHCAVVGTARNETAAFRVHLGRILDLFLI